MRNNFFNTTSKAEVIKFLEKKKLKFKIPKTSFFNIQSWNDDKKKIYKNLITEFKNKKKIIIRSSTRFEDSSQKSQAGKFLSILDVNIKDKNKFYKSVNKVILSYGKSRSNKDQILVQEMISNVYSSGVVFTKDIESGNDYYVINYDDVTGKTNTVTSGSSFYSNRILYIYKNHLNKIKSYRFKKLIHCVKNLETVLNNDLLDIEFAISKDQKFFLLQVRPISTSKKWKLINKKNIEKIFSQNEKLLSKKFKSKKKLNGNTTIFGNMPDWNPAEIIGKYPSELSYSLYKFIITDSTWAEARSIMGYKELKNEKLMNRFCGQPYIDIRSSLNSFLPKNLNNKISEKIINQGIQILKENHQFHDKIEFEISIPSFDFDTKSKIQQKFGKVLAASEQKIFLKSLKNLTIKFFKKETQFSIDNSLKKIEEINSKYKNYLKSDINDLNKILLTCKNIGTLYFSILARHAFVAKSFLNSLVNQKILTTNQVERFEQNLNTITSKILNDMLLVKQKKISKKKFMNTYGHLRPGTYDICSPRYEQIKKFKYDSSIKKNHNKNFYISRNQKNKINKLLLVNKFNINYEIFLDYIGNAISLREYSKFIFTKYLSLILEILAKHGKTKNLSREIISNINLNIFKSSNIKNITNKGLKRISLYNKNKLNFLKNIRLPSLLIDSSNIRIVPYQVNLPNFITQKKIKGYYSYLTPKNKFKNLEKKIVLIENADPGYDWIFGYNILGLVTKYGGINSHTSIRCAELSIPAVIGCGDQIFSELLKKKSIYLDCSSSAIYSI